MKENRISQHIVFRKYMTIFVKISGPVLAKTEYFPDRVFLSGFPVLVKTVNHYDVISRVHEG